MVFLNLALLGGLAAIGVPLAIHLLNRRKSRVVNWAAMRFLLNDDQQQARKWQWQRWLLLLLRCAIPVLLALLMARPALTSFQGWQSSLTETKRTFVLLDTTASMQAESSTNQSARNHAQIAERLAQSDLLDSDVTLVTNSDPALWQTLTAADRTATQLTQQFDEGEHPANFGLAQQLQAIETAIQDDSQTQSRFIVVSDFQTEALASIGGPTRSAFAAILKNASLPPQLIFVPAHLLAERPQQLPNLAVRFSLDGNDLIGPEQQARLKWTAANKSDAPEFLIPVRIAVDGTVHSTTQLDLAANQMQERSLLLPPLTIGDHHVTLHLDHDDALPMDNYASWIIRVVEPQPILLLGSRDARSLAIQKNKANPKTARTAYIPSTSFLQLAIAPPEFSTDADVATATRLPRTLRCLGPVDIEDRAAVEQALQQKPIHIILADVPKMDNGLWLRIVEQSQFGSITILAGGQIDTRWYEQHLSDSSGTKWKFDTKTQQSFESRKLQYNDITSDPLISTILTAMKPDYSVNVETMWTFADNQIDGFQVVANCKKKPFLLVNELQPEATCRWLFMASDLALASNNLATRDSFVPLIQNTYNYLAFGSQPPRNIAFGQSLPGNAEQGWRKVWQAGVQIAEPKSAAFANTSAVFEATLPDRLLATTQLPSSESEVTIADQASVQQFVTELGGNLYDATTVSDSLPIHDASVKTKVDPKAEIWRWVLAILLCVTFGELVLQQLLARNLA